MIVVRAEYTDVLTWLAAIRVAVCGPKHCSAGKGHSGKGACLAQCPGHWHSWLSGRELSERLEVAAMIVCELKKKWESSREKEMMGDI